MSRSPNASRLQEGGSRRVALIDIDAQEIHVKIVYFGPEMSGKTTSLQAIASGVPAACRGNLRSIASESARTIFSDSLLIDLGTTLGFRLNWHLYTAPGQPRSTDARTAVIQGADGIVFVADSAPLRVAENLHSFAELSTLLEQGKGASSLPLVVSCNKSDIPGALEPGVVASSLEIDPEAVFSTSAINGAGVFDSLRHISRMVVAQL